MLPSGKQTSLLSYLELVLRVNLKNPTLASVEYWFANIFRIIWLLKQKCSLSFPLSGLKYMMLLLKNLVSRDAKSN